MITAFINRSPWAVAIITLFLGPVFGFLYLNRGVTALTYLAVTLLTAIFVFILTQHNFIALGTSDAIDLSVFIIQIIGIIHCYQVARSKTIPLPLRFYARWYGMVSIAAAFLIFVILFRIYCFEPFEISGNSMRPNLKQGDMLFSNKFIYHFTPIARGDIVTFKLTPEIIYAKRVVGLPNDLVQIKHGVLYINHQKIERVKASLPDHYIETLPEGEQITVLDDVKDSVYDNTKIFHIPANHYFLLGDNRDHSQDSRALEVGFVPIENITGRLTPPLKNLKTN